MPETETRYDPFQMLSKDGYLVVYRNRDTREVFVEDQSSGATIRITQHSPLGGLQFSADGSIVEPVMVDKEIGWRIRPALSQPT